MANTLYIPRLNPIKFYDQLQVANAAYQSKYLDDYPFREQIEPWQERTKYPQKWQTSDTIPLQVESDFSPLQLDVINRYGNVVTSLVADQIIANKYIPGAYVYEWTLSLAAFEEGCYQFRITNGNLNELNMLSDVQDVRVLQPNTKYIQYRNSQFLGDVIFETGITFNFRVEASFGFLNPGVKMEAYEDQKLNPTVLSARAFRVWPLVIGGSAGVPDWVIDLVNLIWCCNEVAIDGKLFARHGDAELAFDEEEDYPMRAVTIELQEGLNRSSKIVNPELNTNLKLVVIGNIDTMFFGDLSANSSSNLVPVETAG